MTDTFEFTMNNPLTGEQWNIIFDVDHTDRISFNTKHGKEAEFTKVIRCKDCKYRMHDKTCIKVMKRKPDDGFCDEGERKQY